MQILSMRSLVTGPNKPANPQPVAADASSITYNSLKCGVKTLQPKCDINHTARSKCGGKMHGTGHAAVIEKCRRALPNGRLRVNGLFAAVPQIDYGVPQIERNWAAQDRVPPTNLDGFGATNWRARL
ncbi:MAG TPA: hypothetical protein VN968_15305 [Bradyrhizobium sp.]|nr:hypothetical protein [Bradyrhizobium sp.]